MYTPCMFRSNFETLRRKKEYEENRDLTLRQIAADSGLSLGTIQRVKKGEMDRIYLSTLDALCRYFKVKNVGELIEYISEEQ